MKTESSKEESKETLGSEADILKMQIDPAKVTVADIRRYEKLMSGKAVKALSNASVMLGAEMSDAGKRLYTKH